MSRILECPYRACFNSLSIACMKGKFPADCENCNCEEKRYVEVNSAINATAL